MLRKLLTLLALAATLSVSACAKEPEMNTPNAENTDYIVLGMGCFWGAEKRMSEIPGVVDVESGYAGGDAEKAGYYDVLGLEKKSATAKSTSATMPKSSKSPSTRKQSIWKPF